MGCLSASVVQEESLAQTKMALHHAEQELIYITSVIDAVIELHPSTFRQLMNEAEANISKSVPVFGGEWVVLVSRPATVDIVCS